MLEMILWVLSPNWDVKVIIVGLTFSVYFSQYPKYNYFSLIISRDSVQMIHLKYNFYFLNGGIYKKSNVLYLWLLGEK